MCRYLSYLAYAFQNEMVLVDSVECIEVWLRESKMVSLMVDISFHGCKGLNECSYHEL